MFHKEQKKRLAIKSLTTSNKFIPNWIYISFMAVYLSVVFFITLYPFEFQHINRIYHITEFFDGIRFRGYHHCCYHLAVIEPVANVILFIPIGFSLVGFMAGKMGSAKLIVILTLTFSLILTFSIELLQIFINERESSLTDVLMNTTGAFIGYLIFHFYLKRSLLVKH